MMQLHFHTSRKNFHLIASCILFLSLFSCNKKHTSPVAPSQSVQSTPKALLWQISGNSLPYPSYLFGTIHLICPSDLFNDSVIIACLGSSEQLILEINLADPAIPQIVQNKLATPPSFSLRNYFTTGQYDTLQAFFQTNHSMDLASYDRQHPLVLSSLISTGLLSCTGSDAYDNIILDLFLRHSSDSLIVGLETPTQQLDFIWADSLALQAYDLFKTVSHYDSLESLFDTLYRTYHLQDLERLQQMVQSTDSLTSSARLIDTRNLNWMDTLPSLISTKPSFIAVGAGHLGGTLGLVNLLKQRGFTMTPIALLALPKPYHPKSSSKFLARSMQQLIH